MVFEEICTSSRSADLAASTPYTRRIEQTSFDLILSKSSAPLMCGWQCAGQRSEHVQGMQRGNISGVRIRETSECNFQGMQRGNISASCISHSKCVAMGGIMFCAVDVLCRRVLSVADDDAVNTSQVMDVEYCALAEHPGAVAVAVANGRNFALFMDDESYLLVEHPEAVEVEVAAFGHDFPLLGLVLHRVALVDACELLGIRKKTRFGQETREATGSATSAWTTDFQRSAAIG